MPVARSELKALLWRTTTLLMTGSALLRFATGELGTDVSLPKSESDTFEESVAVGWWDDLLTERFVNFWVSSWKRCIVAAAGAVYREVNSYRTKCGM
jgi:hypothetical protein